MMAMARMLVYEEQLLTNLPPGLMLSGQYENGACS
jgi:hypothetical protein